MHHAPWAKAHQLPWPPVTPTDIVMGKATACPPVRETLGSDTRTETGSKAELSAHPRTATGRDPGGDEAKR